MKRLLGLLLVIGMVGCGGGDDAPPAGEAALPATPKTSQANVNEPSVESAASDPSVASESASPTTPADTADDTPAPAADVDPNVESASFSPKTPADTVDDTPAQAGDVDPVAALKKLGAKIVELPNGVMVSLAGTKVTDAGLVHLKGLPNLQSLSFMYTKITDAGLAHLTGMNVNLLDIPTEAKTDLGLKHYLAATKAPTALDLKGWQITDAGLA